MKQWDFDPLGYHPAVDAGFGVSSISDRRQSPWCTCYETSALHFCAFCIFDFVADGGRHTGFRACAQVREDERQTLDKQ